MWEYDRFEIKHKTTNELINELNKIGSKDWEVFHYVEYKPERFGENYTSIVLTKRLIK
jgi:hypothetical protein